MKNKLKRLSMAMALIAALVLMFPFASFADDEMPVTEEIVTEEAGEETSEDTEADTFEPEETEEPEETPSISGEAPQEEFPEEPQDTEKNAEASDPEEETFSDPEPEIEPEPVSPENCAFKRAAERLREGVGYADLSDLMIPEDEEEALMDYLMSLGFIDGDTGEVFFLMDEGYIIAVEIVTEEEEAEESPVQETAPAGDVMTADDEEPSVALPQNDPEEQIMAEPEAECTNKASTTEQPVEESPGEPTGSFICAFILLGSCIKHILQYLV